ncbi:hypothetical protein RE476_09135 [Methanolobus mangrovi]|uniref:Uncharacterized protein n=1 Tax=Methanolobus mangrovi TaxID=3072977 RepID=A0AA51UE84_9EURY|nr:hypothetical protein [Methanolobus mangrovi]WMW21550.1 hypothetical protein RE476_09135 [Methanolobus mangrovi]
MRTLKRDGIKELDERAQLLLIAGFAVGVGIVVLTIMLNNVIYASNIASESSIDTSRYDMANTVQMTSEAYEDAYRYAIEGTNLNSTKFEQYLDEYSETASKNYALSGLTFSFENNTLYEPYFSQNGLVDGNHDWTVISNVNTTDVFLLDIPDPAKLGNSSNSLLVTIDNESETIWSMELYNSNGTININVSYQSSILTYTASNYTSINVTGNEINNVNKVFHFEDNTEGTDYSINIFNGSNTVGYCTFSGNLTSGEEFVFARHSVVNPTVTMSSSEMSVTRNLPISLPGRNI